MTSDESPIRLTPTVRALAPFLDLRTWGAVVYVWLSFPLGLAWFVGLVVGIAAGVPLTLIWVGLLVLFVTFLGAWGAEGLERRLAMVLLGARVPERRVRPAALDAPESARAWLRSVFTSAAMWKGLLFLALRFPIGLAGWVFSVVSFALCFAFLVSPFVVLTGVGVVDLGFWQPATPLGAVPLAILGLVGLVLTLHVHRAIGWMWARLAEFLLGVGAPSRTEIDAPPAPRDENPLSVVPAAG